MFFKNVKCPKLLCCKTSLHVPVAWNHRKRMIANRHINSISLVKFARLRGQKYLKVDALDHMPLINRVQTGNYTPADLRHYMRLSGLSPTRPWNERPSFSPSSSMEIVDEYKPAAKENNSKTPFFSAEGIKKAVASTLPKAGMPSKMKQSLKKIADITGARLTDETFGHEVKEIYINAHKALQERDEEALHRYTTERLFSQMWNELKLRSIKWDFIESLEPPKIVHAITFDQLVKNSAFAQVTLRMHTKQILAIYDQFGYLMFGDPDIARNVLEYVVFERHIVNEHSQWRLHGKIAPSESTAAQKHVTLKTFRKPEPPKQADDEEEETKMPKPVEHELKEEETPSATTGGTRSAA